MSESNPPAADKALSTIPTLNSINEVICESFDWEVLRLLLKHKTNVDNKEHERVIGWIYQKYIEIDYAMFFTDLHVKKIAEEIFQDVTLRTFILNLTERISNALLDLPQDLLTQFEDRLCATIERTRIDPESDHSSLIINNILASFKIAKGAAEIMLKGNPWLMYYHQLLMCFQHTSTFKDLVTSKK